MNKKIKFYYSITTYIIFGVFSIITTFYVPYLNQSIGLSLTEIGQVVSIGALFAIFAQPFLVNRLSRTENKKKFIITHLSILILMIILLMFINKNTIYLFAILYGILILTIMPIYEVYVEELSVKQDIEYSEIRKWGSIGFGCIVFLSGVLISKYGFRTIHLLGILMIGITIFMITTKFKNIKLKENRKKVKLITILKNKNVLILGMINILAIGTYNAIEFAYSTYLIDLTGNNIIANNIYSKSIGLRVFIEFLSFIVVTKYFKKGSPKKYLILAFVIAGIKILLFSTGYIPLVVLGDQLHGTMFAVYLTFLFKYIRKIFEEELVGEIFSFVNVLGSAGANFVYPQIFSTIQVNFGYRIMYLVAFSIILFSALISLKILPENEELMDILNEN
ncbi:MFS transporter [Clostridium weizhouense]|uniref:MFS transporter n=1 Tax=Clostridium weizhouense TaxID=2859781 RepID=A0ABS7AQC4_9CLOT|nr:MFS transporter [Clostridium weizhouense]MBW6410834.1 MFS transporter [Clostridium weizhouense]